VIAFGAADELGATGIASGAMVASGDLQRRINRFGSGIGEEHMVQPFRSDICETIRELEGARMAHLERGYEIEAPGCLADRFHDARLSMSGIDAPEAGHSVENPPTVCGDIMHAFCPDEHHRV
jgi:hypothetical protein